MLSFKITILLQQNYITDDAVTLTKRCSDFASFAGLTFSKKNSHNLIEEYYWSNDFIKIFKPAEH